MVKIASLFLLLLGLACEGDSTRKDQAGISGTGSSNTDSDSAIDALVTNLEAEALTVTDLFTADSGDASCLDFQVLAKDAESLPIAGATINFTIATQGVVEDAGALEPESAITNAEGLASTRYCAGNTQISLSLSARVNEVTISSESIQITKKGAFNFVYLESSVEAVKDQEEEIIQLNLIDSGPNDCSTLAFKLEKEGTPVVGRELQFATQYDPPRGVKLAKKNEDGVFESPEGEAKSRAVFTTTSTAEGKFMVPICAGVTLGTTVVSASFTDEDGNLILAQSPVISIRGGLTNYSNFSLTFDSGNARTLKGFFNTNSNYTITTQVKTNTSQDGESITDHPLIIANETGKVRLKDGGAIDASGNAEFTIQALHMIDNYAYRVHPFVGFPDAMTRCDPIQIAASLGGDPNGFAYSELSKNWRSTITYAIRGQEFFYDENRNGIYDAGGDGFWDKNQNGVFDGSDELTYDANNNGIFDYAGEWFIDQPSPFVDSDENGLYDANRDYLIGDTYQAPNGVRDVDANIWKSEVYPIYMGTSSYSLLRSRVQSDYTLFDETIATLPEAGKLFLNDIDGNELFGSADPAIMRNRAVISRHLFAHGICGNPLPGGSKLEMTFAVRDSAAYGARVVSGKFHTVAGDELREPSRRMIYTSADDPNGQTAFVNFNMVDHPRASEGYPLEFELSVTPCINECTGDVVSPAEPVACAAETIEASIKISEPDTMGGFSDTLKALIILPEVKDCNCAVGADFADGVCTCPEGTTFNGAACI